MRVQWISGGDRCRLTKEYNVQVAGIRFTIPSGFEWDGASIPSIFWSVLFVTPFHHTVRRAGLLHDWLYHTSENRVLADSLFLILMRIDGANWAQRTIMYLAVRCFGWIFHKDKNDGK